MAKYLAMFTDNHGEEFDVNGFKIMTEKEMNSFEDTAMSITWPFEYYASSECLYYSSGEDLLSRIYFKEITNSEYDTLDKLFDGEFGTFINEDFLQTLLDGESDIEDESDNVDGWDDDDY